MAWAVRILCRYSTCALAFTAPRPATATPETITVAASSPAKASISLGPIRSCTGTIWRASLEGCFLDHRPQTPVAEQPEIPPS